MLNQWFSIQTQLSLNRTVIQRYFRNFQWEKIFNHLFEKIAALILISLFFWIIKAIGRKFIQHSFNHYLKNKKTVSSEKRLFTLHTLTFNAFQYALGFFWIYSLLSIIGIPIGTLVASAGIFSLAIGLGAQGFVSDIVNGFFILFEKQLDVGEYVSINNIQGTVTAIGLRTTKVTSPEGIVNFIPNRNITIISNFSRNDMTDIIQVKINPNTSIQKSLRVIQHVNQVQAPQEPDIIGQPALKGIITLPDGDPAIQIYIITKNQAQFVIKRRFYQYYLEALRKAGINLPSSSNPA